LYLIGSPDPALHGRWADADLHPTANLAAALAAHLHTAQPGLVAAPQLRELLASQHLLHHLRAGVALLDLDTRILWQNPALSAWTNASVGEPLMLALGQPTLTGADPQPFATAQAGQPATARLHRAGQYLDLQLTPILLGTTVTYLIAVCQDVTADTLQQEKADALHRAGLELSALDPAHLAEMTVDERIELLKLNLRRSIHDLLKYDVIEIRLLDRSTGRLEPLLADGMTPEAEHRVLFARPQDNGVTGYVAATGQSYLCQDTLDDPHYIEGSEDARSSLTVPLMIQGQVIGTLNVESPRPNAFGPDEVRFTELFSKDVAQALYTLELLSAQQNCTASQSIDAINREVALPVDEMLATVTALLARFADSDVSVAEPLRRILAGARSIKQCIQKVGGDLAPANAATLPGLTVPANAGKPLGKLRGLRVLVVDPEERIRQSAHALLDRFGCSVETARTGHEALTLAAHSVYDAVVAAIRLPDLSGYDAYTQLRAAQPKARMILMTGFDYDGSHSIIKARQEGLRLVLYKPFRVDQLLDALISPEPPSVRNEATTDVIQAS
jgi:CheY-like chemotaxis protein